MPPTISFVETMTGQVASGHATPPPDWDADPHGFDVAVRRAATSTGRGATGTVAASSEFGLHDLAIEVQPAPGPDDGLHGAVRGGTVHYGRNWYRVTGGRFVALAASPVRGRRLRYRITGESGTGERVDVAGVKWVSGRPRRWWAETSRMYVVVCTVHPQQCVAAGTVRLGLPAFIRQLTTLRGRPADIATFVARFAARLMPPLGRPPDNRPPRNVSGIA